MQPTSGRVSQIFGANRHFSWQPWGHLGKDYAVVIGTGCVALAAGTVIWADWGQKLPKPLADLFSMIFGSPASGIVVIIKHDGWYSVYAHLDSTHLYSATLLRKASTVVRGQVVGKSGNTGNSTGPHLHFEVFTTDGQNPATFGRYNPDLQIAYEDRAHVQVALSPAPAKPVPLPAPTPSTKEHFTVDQYKNLTDQLAAVRREQSNIKSILASPGGFTWEGKHHHSLWHVLAETQTRVGLIPARVWAHLILNRFLNRKEAAETLLGSNEDRIIRQRIEPLQRTVDELSAANEGLVTAIKSIAAGTRLDVPALVSAVEAAARRGSEAGSHAGASAAIKSIDTTVTIRKEA